MSLVPRFIGRRSSVFDPFSLDLWDPFEGGASAFSRDIGHPARDEATAIANTQIDWKEAPEAPDAHTFKADPPGLKKGDVKKEVEEDRIFYSIDWVSQFWVASSSSAHHSF